MFINRDGRTRIYHFAFVRFNSCVSNLRTPALLNTSPESMPTEGDSDMSPPLKSDHKDAFARSGHENVHINQI